MRGHEKVRRAYPCGGWLKTDSAQAQLQIPPRRPSAHDDHHGVTVLKHCDLRGFGNEHVTSSLRHASHNDRSRSPH